MNALPRRRVPGDENSGNAAEGNSLLDSPDSLVLRLPADEPEGERLDVQAFIEIWPALLVRWKSIEQPQRVGTEESNFTLVRNWLRHARDLRTELEVERGAATPVDADPGA